MNTDAHGIGEKKRGKTKRRASQVPPRSLSQTPCLVLGPSNSGIRTVGTAPQRTPRAHTRKAPSFTLRGRATPPSKGLNPSPSEGPALERSQNLPSSPSPRVIRPGFAGGVGARVRKPLLRELGAQIARKGKSDCLVLRTNNLHRRKTTSLQPFDDLAHKDLRNRRSRSQAHGLRALEPFGLKLFSLVDTVSATSPGLERNLHEAHRV